MSEDTKWWHNKNEPNRILQNTQQNSMNILSKMNININVFSKSKTELTRETNQDAMFPCANQITGLVPKQKQTFAIADGVSSSPDPKVWANMLVQEAQKWNSEASNFLNDISELKEAWKKDWEPRKNEILENKGAWWSSKTTAKPNASTICSITIKQIGNNFIRWDALAVGDSCLFHFREGELASPSFPLEHPDDFSNHPGAIHSTAQNDTYLQERIREKRGVAKSGDIFVLATDAMAKWIMETIGNNPKKIQSLIENPDGTDFNSLVQIERENFALDDDDSTLMIIRIS